MWQGFQLLRTFERLPYLELLHSFSRPTFPFLLLLPLSFSFLSLSIFPFFELESRACLLMKTSGSVICMVNDIPTINKYGELEIIHTMRPGPFGMRKVQRSH